MNWLWLNVPLMAVFFLAMTGIPLWLTFKHPDRRPAQQAQPVLVPGQATIKVRTAGGTNTVPVPVLARR
jgi:hypothetical protein